MSPSGPEPAAEVEERLSSEPPLDDPSPARRAARLLGHAAATVLVALVNLPFWPLYLAMAARHGRAPIVPRARQILRYLRLAATVRPPPPGLTPYDRAWLAISTLRLGAGAPFWGAGWLLDEVLYGDDLRAVEVEAPLIELSAARSGSTQLGHYLEGDPHLVAPPLIHCFFPFVWAWRLVPKTIGRFVSPEQATARLLARMPKPFLERHEADPFRTDTFEVVFYQSHCIPLSLRLGPEVLAEEFSFGRIGRENHAFWEVDFLHFFDGVVRKTLLEADPGPDGARRRLFIKGHFLAAADVLARRYPDARFLTVIREPVPRIESTINFLRATSFNDANGGPPPWAWLGRGLAEAEADYCEIEHEWFTRREGPRRCVVRFSDYVRDLEGTLSQVYRECLDQPTLPPWAPREHAPRKRHDYTYDRSLAEVGIDGAALDERLAGYVAWCRGDA